MEKIKNTINNDWEAMADFKNLTLTLRAPLTGMSIELAMIVAFCLKVLLGRHTK